MATDVCYGKKRGKLCNILSSGQLSITNHIFVFSRRETRAPRTDIAKVIENDNLHDGGLCWPESFAFDVPGSSPNASGAPSFCSASRHSTSKEHAPASNLDVMFSHYGFLEDESSSHLAPDDYKFLKYKGCFHLPCRRALHEFVRAYFLYIHPALPLFDEHQVWDMLSLNPQNAGRRMPLFVLRCILFVSSSVCIPSLYSSVALLIL